MNRRNFARSLFGLFVGLFSSQSCVKERDNKEAVDKTKSDNSPTGISTGSYKMSNLDYVTWSATDNKWIFEATVLVDKTKELESEWKWEL